MLIGFEIFCRKIKNLCRGMGEVGRIRKNRIWGVNIDYVEGLIKKKRFFGLWCLIRILGNGK